MSSLIRRSAILAFSRFSNYSIMVFSPIILVRILDVQQYGEYREFLLYAGLLGAIFDFSVNRSLSYFIPKFPECERIYVTQAVIFQILFCAIGIALVSFFGDYIRELTSFDFVWPLALYLFFFLTFDFIELYWLAKKRTDLVLYYSSTRLLVRMIAVTVTAYYSRDVEAIIYSLIYVEAIRFALVVFFSIRGRLIAATDIAPTTLRAQASYFVPLGVASIVFILNRDIGKLYISIYLGAAPLAFYVVGTYMLPLINIFRSSIMDVIFPEIVWVKKDPWDALHLWRRSTVLYCFLLFPLGFVLFYYADIIVITLFTNSYADAISVFQVFVLLIFTQCFDFHLPLRTINKNIHFLVGTILSLIVNLGLIVALSPWLGLIGPAVAFVTADIVMASYMADRMRRIFKVAVSDMLPWQQIGMIFAACIACVPVLLIGDLIPMPEVLRAIAFTALYGILFFTLVYYLVRIEEINDFVRRLGRRLYAS